MLSDAMPVNGLTLSFSPSPRMAPPPLGSDIDGGSTGRPRRSAPVLGSGEALFSRVTGGAPGRSANWNHRPETRERNVKTAEGIGAPIWWSHDGSSEQFT